MVKKIIKILLITVAGLITILLLLIFLAGEGFMNGFIARQISKQAGKNINGTLSVGSLKGKLFSHLIIGNIILSDGSDTLIRCESIEIDYNLKQLLKKNLDIRLLRIAGLDIGVRQEQDSSWNIMKIIKENSEPQDTLKNPSSWKLSMKDFILENMSASISALDTGMIPSSLGCGIRLKGSVNADTINAEINSLRISTRKPDFQLVNLSGKVRKAGNDIQWQNVNVELSNTIGHVEGLYRMKDKFVETKLGFKPLAFEDLAPFLKGLNLYGDPNVEAKISGDSKKYDFSLVIEEKNQKIDFSGNLKDPLNNPLYSAELALSAVDVYSWTHVKEAESDITGKFEISGKGFDIRKNDVELKGQFGRIKYGDYTIRNLLFNVLKNNDRVSGKLSPATLIGNADMKFDLSDVFGDRSYNVEVTYSGINAGKLPGMDSLSTDLNGSLNVRGRGISPENIDAGISLRSYDSKINSQKIGDFNLTAGYRKGNYEFKIPGIETPFFNIRAEGSGDIKKQNRIAFTFEPMDLYVLLKSFGMPEASLSGMISGDVSGPSESLRTKLNLDLMGIAYDSIRVKSIKGDIDAEISGKTYKGDIRLNADSVIYGSYSVKSADIDAALSDNKVKTVFRVNVNDSLLASFDGSIEGFEDPLVRINDLEIILSGTKWKSTTDSASVKLNKDAIHINNFGLSSGTQELAVKGIFALNGDEDLSLRIDSLLLQSLPAGLLPLETAGTISANMSLKGTSSAPLVNAKVHAEGMNFSDYKIDSLRLLMNYGKEVFSADGEINFGQQEPVKIIAHLPVRLSFTDSIKLLKDRPGLLASASLDNIDLNKLSSLIPVKNISVSGSASVEVVVNNTISDPVIKGSLDILDGAFRSKGMGIDYRDIQLSAVVDSQRLNISKFDAITGKGNIGISGSINLNSRDSLNSKDVAMTLKATDFQAIKSGNAELNFDSDIGITGSFAKPEMKGTVSINSSKVNIDYFTSKFSRIKDDPNPPLLEQALNDTTAVVINPDTTSAGISGSSLIRNLMAELVIDIPGNTWVTGKDMNFELVGKLRAVKSSPDISLFGKLSVKRGYYKIYGRKFEFNKGNITFTGGSEFNPQLDLEIVYRFRDIEKNMRDLKLGITGNLLQPKYAFILDNETIEEKDAISYIAFGKSINQLGEGEKAKMSGQDIAMGAAVTQLSSVLKGVLQEEAGVDVFEFTGGEDWKSGNVTIGKYITNKLYLSYDRNFDFDKQRKTSVTEKIMLEYQILRKLLLKATNQDVNSGFDLIFKKTWK